VHTIISSNRILSMAVSAVLIAAGAVSPVRAATPDTAAAPVLEEIIVTAQKRVQSLQDVPVAVTAVTAAALDQAQVRDLRELQRLVPSLVVTQADSSAQTVFAIRGLSTSGFNAGLESAVGVVIDGVYRGRQAEAIDDLVDVEQVEVLRGPQSTLFGKNTTAGVINIRTQAPTFESGGFGELTLGDYNSQVLKGAINLPINESTAAVRLDGSYNHRDGFIENLQNGKHVNDRDRYSLRAQLLLLPTPDVTVRIIADTAHLQEACCAAPFYYNDPTNVEVITALGGTILPSGPYARKVKFDGGLETKLTNSGLSAQVDWNLDFATLTSITAYRYYDQYDQTDVDFTDLSLIGYNASSSITKSFSQELRLASKGKERVDWLAGLYYFNQDLTSGGPTTYGTDLRAFADLLSGGYVDFVEQDIMGLPPGTYFAEGQGLVKERYAQSSETTAVFGNLDFHVTDKLTLSAGLRYETASKHASSDIIIDDPFAAIDFTTFLGGALEGLSGLQFYPPVDNFDKRMTESDTSGKGTVTYAFNGDVNAYASYAHGVKAGGFNLSTTASQSGFSFKPERIDAVELGLKTRAWNDRLTANFALFDEKVKDYQANVFDGTAFILENAGSIRLKGAELDASALLARGLLASLGVAYLDGKIESFPNGPCPTLATTPSCDLAGKDVPDAPDWTVSAALTYEWPLTSNLNGFGRAGAYYRSSRYVMLSNEPRSLQGATTEVDASAGVKGSSGKWDVTLWGRNLTDAHYAQTMFNSVAQYGSLSGYPNDPQTFGLTMRVNF
jgi:iron complex outermembrane receptor protein